MAIYWFQCGLLKENLEKTNKEFEHELLNYVDFLLALSNVAKSNLFVRNQQSQNNQELPVPFIQFVW